MIFGIMLESDQHEETMIRQCLRDLTAYGTDEKLELPVFQKSCTLLQQIEQMELLDAAVVDVTLPGGLDAVRQIRKKFAKAEILVIADSSVSPMKYMHPSIRASGLLLRPPGKIWVEAIRDFFGQIAVMEEPDGQDEVFWIKNRDGTFRIPFSRICYLEAREKKVFIRTGMEEFGISTTIEKIAEQLPENFQRCHRSFVVNMDCVTQIRLSENLLYLGKDLFVPVSRSYKGLFKRQSNE